MGQTMGPRPQEMQHSDIIILWGLHALATNVHILHDIKVARQQGAKVWLIDTYETPTAAIADKVIVVRPGTDGALALGMMHVIARENLADKEFISEYVQGYEELAAAVLPDPDGNEAVRCGGIRVEKGCRVCPMSGGRVRAGEVEHWLPSRGRRRAILAATPGWREGARIRRREPGRVGGAAG